VGTWGESAEYQRGRMGPTGEKKLRKFVPRNGEMREVGTTKELWKTGAGRAREKRI